MAINANINDRSKFDLGTRKLSIDATWANVAVPVGRFFYSLIFIFSSLFHFRSSAVDYATSQGVPLANLLVPLSGLMILIGGVSILLGYRARVGAILIVLFLIPVTLIMHKFWTINDPMMAQIQQVNFMKNISMLGAAILICYFGSGPISLDNQSTKYER